MGSDRAEGALAPAVAGGGGSLSTASNLLFGSDGTGKFFAVDAATGETALGTQLFPGVATPVTYMLDGKQYVSVMSGSTRGHVFTFVLDGAAAMPSRTGRPSGAFP